MNKRRLPLTVYTASVLTLALLAGAAAAEPIYRSVDADGNVTFSGTPPANAAAVEEVSVQPGPSAAAQREARERTQRQEAAASVMSEARAGRAQQPPSVNSSTADDAAHEDSGYYSYGYHRYPNTGRRDQIRDAVRERLQERPVQLPARPISR